MLFLLIISFTLPGVADQGDRVFYFDARSLALGGVATVLENGHNPASIGFVNAISLNTSASFIIPNEKRGLRVYDSYGNNIGISTVSNNTFTTINLGASRVVFPWNFLRIGIKYSPLWDFDYSYRLEYRDDFYQVTRIEENLYDGHLYTISPILAVNYTFIKIGLEEDFIFGKRFRKNKIIIPQVTDSILQEENKYDGTNTKFGVIIAPNVHFRFAYSYRLEYNVDDEDLIYPAAHSFGFLYQPPGRIPTKFVGELNLEMWDKHIFIYKFGVEHTILDKYSMRYGFCIFPDYKQSAVWTTVLTVGFGLNTNNYYFDIGYGYGKRDYLNSDFETFDVGENLKFDETINHFLISSGIHF